MLIRDIINFCKNLRNKVGGLARGTIGSFNTRFNLPSLSFSTSFFSIPSLSFSTSFSRVREKDSDDPHKIPYKMKTSYFIGDRRNDPIQEAQMERTRRDILQQMHLRLRNEAEERLQRENGSLPKTRAAQKTSSVTFFQNKKYTSLPQQDDKPSVRVKPQATRQRFN
jgi:hypothetical protein